MKEILKELAAYNIWATQKLTDLILSLPPEKQVEEVKSSFASLHTTLLHMWDAESAWWQRMKLQERIQRPSENFTGNTADVVKGLQQQSRLWEEWISNASDHSFDHVFMYTNAHKEQFKQPLYQMMLHVFNHGTYHRGQLITMLHQLGVGKLPQTDFVVFCRNKK
ncbi:MAG: DinB family protein [Chitinophagaceae bacterium]|nr:DinB family protein [Chitinophagaceae bacterium]MBL0334776.1 DinB family protein [Chitinophagaceae bacterium]